MLQTLTFNGARVINAEASFFRYESGSAGGDDEAIKLRADGQDLGIYYPGDSVELPDRRQMWELTPISAACAGTVRLGVGRVQSARLVGQVSVIDTTRFLVNANKKFACTALVQAGTAGQFAQAQLYNGSTTTGIAVRGLWVFQSDAAGLIHVCNSSAPLTGGAVANIVSKKMTATGQPAMVAGIQTSRKPDGASAGFLGVNGQVGNLAASIYVPAGAQQTRMPLDDGPLIVGPGAGLVLAHNVAASGMTAYFEGEVFDW